MFEPLPPTGARTLDARTAFYYSAILDSPAIIMRLPDAGSQYLFGSLDNHGEPFDGSKTYNVTLPPDIPARAFWSLTLYDNQTRSMLQTPQKYPRAGNQSYPSRSAEADADVGRGKDQRSDWSRGPLLFPSRIRARPHKSTRQYGRIVDKWFSGRRS
jgi:hypothetical protein